MIGRPFALCEPPALAKEFQDGVVSVLSIASRYRSILDKVEISEELPRTFLTLSLSLDDKLALHQHRNLTARAHSSAVVGPEGFVTCYLDLATSGSDFEISNQVQHRCTCQSKNPPLQGRPPPSRDGPVEILHLPQGRRSLLQLRGNSLL